MAPLKTVASAAPQKQPRRQAPRIIPAIPRRFARPPAATRPITPDESTINAAVTQREPTPQPADEKLPERESAPLQAPPTPDSKASVADHGDANGDVNAREPVRADSSARSEDGRAGESVVDDTQGAVEESREKKVVVAAEKATPASQPEPKTVAVNGNGNRPKPTVPTELPPEFYPREKPNAFPPPASFPMHHFAPNMVENLVFGGPVQDSPAIPSTPQEFEPEMPAPQSTYARPPPGFAPHLAPQFFPGHSHHPSDPAASWIQPPYSMAPPPEALYTSPTYPPGSASFQTPYQVPFPIQTGPGGMNHTTSPHSQSPNTPQFGDGKVGSGEEQHASHANGTASRRLDASNDGHDMARHMFGFFGNPEFTDYVLCIRSPDAVHCSMPIHAVIGSRSPVILEALRRSSSSSLQGKDSRPSVDILTDDVFVTPESLHEAVKILYGGPTLAFQPFVFGLEPYDGSSEKGSSFNEARRRMGQVISYAAAGRVLQIPEMQTCGLRVAKALLRWDTVDQVLHFGLTANQTKVQPSTSTTDNRLLETYAIPLLDDALEFIAYNFPPNFSLYSLAPEMRQYPRLPTIIEQRQPAHNPRLSKIRFGDAPPEEEKKPGHTAQILSSILLSLPIPLLDRLFSHPAAANQVGWSSLVGIMRDVVAERERRRQKALQSGSALDRSSVPQSLLENLYREERVDPSIERPSGFILTSVRAQQQKHV